MQLVKKTVLITFILLTAGLTAAIADTTVDIENRPALPMGSESEYVSWMLENTEQEEKFIRWRWDTVLGEGRKYWSGFRNERVQEAYLRTPREDFCRPQNRSRAYEHTTLPIGYGQTISGIYAVGRMTDWLNPEPHHKVLEIGTGSGYQSAVLAELSEHVYTIEIVPQLAEETDGIYTEKYNSAPQYKNITRKQADGYYGWEEYAPFDRIIVTCGIDHIPPALLQQLKPDGMMLIPVGPPSGQTILSVTKEVDEDGDVFINREDIYGGRVPRSATTFVPFTSEDGGTHYRSGS